ncbi:hypothetical protein IMSAGC011_03198 [Lachnospiraceae bacterium]|nr:hypothetical protein IMSAGC011_03198 [Lachnospiraceae bacterium]
MKYLYNKMVIVIMILIVLSGMFVGCENTKGLKDGFYTAEMAEYHYGWIEYLIIQVKNDKIVSAEYNARNESGFVKSWDNAYMKNMMPGYGTYPNKYTREYVQQLIDSQVNTKVDVITGATSSGKNFEKLVAAVLRQAATGNSATVVVE